MRDDASELQASLYRRCRGFSVYVAVHAVMITDYVKTSNTFQILLFTREYCVSGMKKCNCKFVFWQGVMLPSP